MLNGGYNSNFYLRCPTLQWWTWTVTIFFHMFFLVKTFPYTQQYPAGHCFWDFRFKDKLQWLSGCTRLHWKPYDPLLPTFCSATCPVDFRGFPHGFQLRPSYSETNQMTDGNVDVKSPAAIVKLVVYQQLLSVAWGGAIWSHSGYPYIPI